MIGYNLGCSTVDAYSRFPSGNIRIPRSLRRRGDAGLRDHLIMIRGIGGHTDRSDDSARPTSCAVNITLAPLESAPKTPLHIDQMNTPRATTEIRKADSKTMIGSILGASCARLKGILIAAIRRYPTSSALLPASVEMGY
jgi:hypothetical protein